MFTSMDVYDAASSIGRDCQLLTTQYGPELLSTLMPKVVSALEDLEAFTSYAEQEQSEVQRLQSTLKALKEEKVTQVELKSKYDRGLEQMERSLYNESQTLLAKVTSLEEENRRLAQQLAESDEASLSGASSSIQARVQSPLPGRLPGLEAYHVTNQVTSTSAAGTVVRAAAQGKLIMPQKPRPLSAEKLPGNLHLALHKSSSGSDLSSTDTGLLVQATERLELTEQESRIADLQLIGRLKTCSSENSKAIRQFHRELLETSAALDAAEEELCRLARVSGTLMASRAPAHRPTGQLIADKARLVAELYMKEKELARLTDTAAPSSLQHRESGEDASNLPFDTVTLKSPPHLHLTDGQGANSAERVKSQTPPLSPGEGLITPEELSQLLQERNELRCRLIELEEELHFRQVEESKEPDVEGPMWPEPPEKLRPNWNRPPEVKSMFHDLLCRLSVKVSSGNSFQAEPTP